LHRSERRDRRGVRFPEEREAKMAEPEGQRQGMNNAVLGLLVLVVVLLVAFFIVESQKRGDRGVDIDVNVPAADGGAQGGGGAPEGGGGGPQ
jgi:hypothetical protein